MWNQWRKSDVNEQQCTEFVCALCLLPPPNKQTRSPQSAIDELDNG